MACFLVFNMNAFILRSVSYAQAVRVLEEFYEVSKFDSMQGTKKEEIRRLLTTIKRNDY